MKRITKLYMLFLVFWLVLFPAKSIFGQLDTVKINFLFKSRVIDINELAFYLVLDKKDTLWLNIINGKMVIFPDVSSYDVVNFNFNYKNHIFKNPYKNSDNFYFYSKSDTILNIVYREKFLFFKKYFLRGLPNSYLRNRISIKHAKALCVIHTSDAEKNERFYRILLFTVYYDIP